ncbi:putative metal-dependent enzyme (double-stranded beta helix superfamily) [Micromonospora pisi]|uniref:Putative metal-dependent enzyme (Double-stranded beta helix superfamily) n=1 Tax=Micromonospora pisi TaxID=589240 RepID=A0A495JLX8_9ACTN|nr:cysteine dioxygenase family protein [Micromonospora pisi]RKR89558.1 putative metal-dependent enzyme (double-stranded beta helix superfamily) [Micromonospora pisi]
MSTNQLDDLVRSVRIAANQVCPPEETAQLVSAALRANLPTREILTPEQLAGDPDSYVQHVLHVEPDGLFSVVALVWRPGQATPIHDHLCWCVVGVVDGVESEVRYEVTERDGDVFLTQAEVTENLTGSVCGIAPPGDIHEVRNAGTDTAVSIHIYGADISRVGTSIRRRYQLPVLVG